MEPLAVEASEDVREGERGVEAAQRPHDELRAPAGDFDLAGQLDGEAGENVAGAGREKERAELQKELGGEIGGDGAVRHADQQRRDFVGIELDLF